MAIQLEVQNRTTLYVRDTVQMGDILFEIPLDQYRTWMNIEEEAQVTIFSDFQNIAVSYPISELVNSSGIAFTLSTLRAFRDTNFRRATGGSVATTDVNSVLHVSTEQFDTNTNAIPSDVTLSNGDAAGDLAHIVCPNGSAYYEWDGSTWNFRVFIPISTATQTEEIVRVERVNPPMLAQVGAPISPDLTLANASSGVTTAIGIIDSINGVNYSFVTSGLVTLSDAQWQAVIDDGSSLVAGEYYYTSDQTAGELSRLAPTAGTSFDNPVGFALSTTEFVVMPYRPVANAGAEPTNGNILEDLSVLTGITNPVTVTFSGTVTGLTSTGAPANTATSNTAPNGLVYNEAGDTFYLLGPMSSILTFQDVGGSFTLTNTQSFSMPHGNGVDLTRVGNQLYIVSDNMPFGVRTIDPTNGSLGALNTMSFATTGLGHFNNEFYVGDFGLAPFSAGLRVFDSSFMEVRSITLSAGSGISIPSKIIAVDASLGFLIIAGIRAGNTNGVWVYTLTGAPVAFEAIDGAGAVAVFDGSTLGVGIDVIGGSPAITHRIVQQTGTSTLAATNIGILVKAGDSLTLPNNTVVAISEIVGDDEVRSTQQLSPATLTGNTTRNSQVGDIVTLVSTAPNVYAMRS